MKTYLCAILTVTMCIKAAAQSDVAVAKWMQQPATIDGRLTEWKQPLNFYDSDTKLLFDIANDTGNIYLCFESKDEMSQAKLMRGGMKITLSIKGKSKHEGSVTYPLSQKQVPQNSRDATTENEENGNPSDKSSVYDLSSFRNHFIQNHQVMNVEGFFSTKGEVPLTNPSGINVAINWDSASNFIYEIAIPKKEVFGNSYSAKEIAASVISLAVEINALPRSSSDDKSRDNEPNDNDMRGNKERLDSRRGQFNGGGYGTGNVGPRQLSATDKVSLYKKSSFRQKFSLSND